MDGYKIARCCLSLIFSLILFVKFLPDHVWALKNRFQVQFTLLINRLLPRRKKLSLHSLPNHLGVILTESSLCLDSVCKSIYYCFRYGVKKVSVYSAYGLLEPGSDNSAKLIAMLAKKLKFRALLVINGLEKTSGCKEEKERKIDELTDQLPKFDLYILGVESGRTTLSLAAKEMCRLERKDQHDSSRLLADLLSRDFNIFDLDFALIFGQVPSVLGYPPTALHLAELLFLPCGHKNFTEASLVECLEVFAKRNRRFGK